MKLNKGKTIMKTAKRMIEIIDKALEQNTYSESEEIKLKRLKSRYEKKLNPEMVLGKHGIWVVFDVLQDCPF